MREFVAWEAAHGAERDAERDAELADLADVGDEFFLLSVHGHGKVL